MDWLLHGVGSHLSHQKQQHAGQQQHPTPRPPLVPQMQGDPTFLYGGYGYRPPTFGYAWLNGANQPTSFGQLPADASAPKTLSKSVSAPNLQNLATVEEELQKNAHQQAAPQSHSKLPTCPEGTPSAPSRHQPHHAKHLSGPATTPSTPMDQSAANTPSSSRASTPPRRVGGISDSYYIGMAAA